MKLRLFKRRWRKMEWTREGDRQWGPFLHSRDRYHQSLAVLFSTVVDGDEAGSGNELRISGFGHTFKIGFPTIIKPKIIRIKAQYWSKETIERMGRDWYEIARSRVYGFSSSQGFFQLRYGADDDDTFGSGKTKSFFLPWREWRHVRHTLYDLDGNVFWEESTNRNTRDWMDARDEVPSSTFEFKDYDGEVIQARAYTDEREWRWGDKWCKWLGYLRKPKIKRSLELMFTKEVGKEKGSWKGGTMGHSIETQLGETPQQAFIRYCEQHELTFLRCVEPNHPRE